MSLPDQEPARDVVVEGVEQVAQGVVSLVLVSADGQPLPTWDPGSHIDLILDPGLERQYSLCGDPAHPTHWRIGVLLERDGGRGGSARAHRVKPGERLQTRGPRNHFPLVDSERYLFIAGGIGITPILPMVERVARGPSSWRLVYGGREAESMAFTERFEPYGDAVTLWPQDEHGLLPLDELLGDADAETAVYCCGPGPLLDAVEERCARWREGALHVERFAPLSEALLHESSRPFKVRLARSGVTLDVGADETILQVLEAAGIHPATSCRQGTCGTCETTVLEGVPDHRDSILTEAEQEQGDTMMICCGRSLSSELVLDL